MSGYEKVAEDIAGDAWADVGDVEAQILSALRAAHLAGRIEMREEAALESEFTLSS